jgi:hypothetical protein
MHLIKRGLGKNQGFNIATNCPAIDVACSPIVIMKKAAPESKIIHPA